MMDTRAIAAQIAGMNALGRKLWAPVYRDKFGREAPPDWDWWRLKQAVISDDPDYEPVIVTITEPLVFNGGQVVRYESRPASDSLPFDEAPFRQSKDTGQ